MNIRLLKQFAENKYVNLLSGLILLSVSAVEIVNTLEEASVGAHHGLAIFALLQLLKVLPEIVHGTEEISKISD
uniref:Uncharacterized protein n=1 Tax=Candidatus Kentrum sp. FM TaxID=2126340 RepID=A0A450S3M8_9GAMM|nr:MAG: hypothetical protein BECKFM1743C_GA0114222_100354 [Candidatus Kentron sp. FM]VFJ46257.1 MAG: hypothetical protein BECKFM1743A_GA0114220_1003410 [Candidatus Kentron sp. FM]VFK10927.1 MAG: hypothetical protein BECKFM1743B_GA0114221_101605 [Candidatus Kentron sp. FM]